MDICIRFLLLTTAMLGTWNFVNLCARIYCGEMPKKYKKRHWIPMVLAVPAIVELIVN